MRRFEARLSSAAGQQRRLGFWVLVVVGLVFLLSQVRPSLILTGLLKPISVFSQITGSGKLDSDENHTNVLILGLDRHYPGTVGLTDTIIVASLEIRGGRVSLFSVPRDVWVSRYQSKVNALYALGGIDLARKVIGEILGLPIHYFIILDFAGFERAVDAIGGLEINVERPFEDTRYPILSREEDDCGGDPEYNCRYQTIRFPAGLQKMNGATALQFSRSRQATGPEGSDFARASRQQKIIAAFKDKVLSLTTLINPATLAKLFEEYKSSVTTNVGLLEVERFYSLSQKIGQVSIRSYVINRDLADEEILYNPADFAAFGGQWVLVPRAGDFSEVHTLVQKVLFGEQ